MIPSTGPCAIVLADDLTGAADTGAQFTRFGVPTRVWLGMAAAPSFGAIVYDTNSRSLPAVRAAARVGRLARSLHNADGLVYKKIDSTVRGNVGAESAALLTALGRSLAVVAPAFPANGRTTRGGVQLVNGVPVHLTAAASDPAHPMPHPTIAAALRAQSDLPLTEVDLPAVRRGLAALADELRRLIDEPPPSALGGRRAFAVIDAESDDDLETIAAAVAALEPDVLPVGSAGLAAHVARRAGCGSPPHWVARARAARPLFVCGSLNPATLGQVAALERALGAESIDAFVRGALAEAARRLANGPTVLTTGQRRPDADAHTLALTLARGIADLVDRAHPDALILTGGDVARTVLSALRADGIELLHELLPGLPVGRLIGGRLDGAIVLTKAGGFGPPEALVKALRYLDGSDPAPREETL